MPTPSPERPVPAPPRSRSARRIRRLSAVIRQRCPCCLEGHVFRSTLRMLPACQQCGYRFHQDAGGDAATLAASAVAGALLIVMVLAAAWRWLVPTFGLPFAMTVASFLWLLLLPGVVRYARIVRAHLAVRALERAPR